MKGFPSPKQAVINVSIVVIGVLTALIVNRYFAIDSKVPRMDMRKAG